MSLTFTYSGAIQPRSQVNLAPRSSGRLERILVEVGAEVNEGDPIAVLEHSSLELAVQQAEANYASAVAKLATIQAGGRPEDIASAEAALTSARAKLNQTTSGPTPSDL